MSADRDTMERREGWKHMLTLPDEGPWALFTFKGRVFTVSQVSGAYEIQGETLRKIELIDGEKT